jgi:hypothetical protein
LDELTRDFDLPFGRLTASNDPMRWTGAWILAVAIAVSIAVMLLVLHRTRLGWLIHEHIPDRPHRRLFLASVSFFLTFASVRALTYAIHEDIGPFHNITMGGRHVHHLVWGILILLFVGYSWLLELGDKGTTGSILMSRLISLLYGTGAALTLDEFALWLNLRDVYWAREGRSSIDAIILFGSLLAIATWGAPLFKGIWRQRKRTA